MMRVWELWWKGERMYVYRTANQVGDLEGLNFLFCWRGTHSHMRSTSMREPITWHHRSRRWVIEGNFFVIRRLRLDSLLRWVGIEIDLIWHAHEFFWMWSPQDATTTAHFTRCCTFALFFFFFLVWVSDWLRLTLSSPLPLKMSHIWRLQFAAILYSTKWFCTPALPILPLLIFEILPTIKLIRWLICFNSV